MCKKVLVIQPIRQNGYDYLKEKGYKVICGSGTTEDEIIRDANDCDGILVRNARITKKIMDAVPKLKVIRHGVGLDTIDVDYARKKGIIVTNSPLSNYNAVAEHTMYFILACAKNACIVNQAFYNGDYDIRHKVTNMELHGKTLGILGLGRVGRAVAKKAKYGFDMDVIGYDPYVKQDVLGDMVTLYPQIKDIAKRADFLTIHLPLTPESKGIINKNVFEIMKQGCFLFNTSRGEVINESDMIDAVKSGKIAGGGFDVLEKEPPVKTHELFDYKNVILTPHNAAHTHEAFERMALHAAQGIDEALSGKDITWRVY